MTDEPCFPEPNVADRTPMRVDGETMPEYLARSTWSRAGERRRFLNVNLAELPAECRNELCGRLRSDATRASEFELLTGRFLQLRGARDLKAHPGAGGRRVDWRAEFADGSLDLEAMVPGINADIGLDLRRQHRLVDALSKDVPPGWTMVPSQLPQLSENASMRALRAVARRLFAQLPPSAPRGTVADLRTDLEGEQVLLRMIASEIGPVASWGSAGGLLNDAERVEAAWLDERKRQQGRAARKPAVLALLGEWSDARQFVRGLLGDELGQGVMARDVDPPWAGVLAFPELYITGLRREAIYLPSPHHVGPVPGALARLSTIRLVDGRIEVTPAVDEDPWSGMEWARAEIPDDSE